MPLQDAIARAISQATGQHFQIDDRRGVDGGCINRAETLQSGNRRYFVKYNDAVRLAMCEAESDGLIEIAASESVRVPQPVCSGAHGGQAYLVLEYIEINRGTDKAEQPDRAV